LFLKKFSKNLNDEEEEEIKINHNGIMNLKEMYELNPDI
jgi:hypothetical protein